MTAHGSAPPRRFARFACLDWSGAAGRWHPGIAIAVCATGHAAPQPVAPPGRHWTRADALDWLAAQAGEDMLIGLDFSPALPRDVMAELLGPDRPVTARALWRLVDEVCADDAHLAATSFVRQPAFAALCRVGRVTGARFGEGGDPNGRLRLVERRPESGHPASALNLVGAKQVGRSSLTGMRVLHRLGDAIPVWPFDPPRASGAVIVEVYTAIAARAARVPRGGKLRDPVALDRALAALGSGPHRPLPRYDDHLTDAVLTAAWLRHAAADPRLWQAPTDPVAMAEGWTFGVPYRMDRPTPG